MKLAKYHELGVRAKSSLEKRAEQTIYFRDEVEPRTFSQAELVDFLSYTDKPFSKTKVGSVMEDMEATKEFSFPRINPDATGGYKLSIDDCIAIADRLGVTKYRDIHNGKPFVINFGNLKGGVGKSLCTNMFAHFLISHESMILSQNRVLIIDLDPQGTTSQQNTPFYKIEDHELTSLHTLIKDLPLEMIQETVIKKTEHKNLDIIVATTDDGFLAEELSNPKISKGKYVGSLLQDRLISKLEGLYDFILIDIGPHMDNTLKNCLWAADQVIIPTPQQLYGYDSTLRFLSRLPTLMEELVENGQSEDDLADLTAFITSGPKTKAVTSERKTKKSQEEIIFKNAAKDLKNVFSLDCLNRALPFEDAYGRCLERGHTIFSMPRSKYEGDKKAFDRAYRDAEEWAKEIADIITHKHGAEA